MADLPYSGRCPPPSSSSSSTKTLLSWVIILQLPGASERVGGVGERVDCAESVRGGGVGTD